MDLQGGKKTKFSQNSPKYGLVSEKTKKSFVNFFGIGGGVRPKLTNVNFFCLFFLKASLRNDSNQLVRINPPCPGDTSCEDVPSIISVETVELKEETPDDGVYEKDILKQRQEIKSEAKTKSGSSFSLRRLLDTDSSEDD